MLVMPIDPPWDQRLACLALGPLRATGITPNAITSASLISGLSAGWLYAQGGWAADLGGLLFMLSLWLDHVDGELARSTGRTSAFGHYYDLVAGGAVLVTLFVGIGIGVPEGALDLWGRSLGLLAGVSIALIFMLRLMIESRLGKDATRQPNLLGFEIEDVLYLVGPITWLGLLAPFLIVAAIGAPLYVLWVLWRFRQMLRTASLSP